MEKHKLTMQVCEGTDFRGVGGLVKRLIHPTTTGSKNIGMGIVYVNPGEKLPPHRHDNEEAYFVIQGTGYMTIEDYDEEINLTPNLSVFIPEGKEHFTLNNGNEPLVMICALSPPPVVK